jgi:hypothetical protein
MSNKYDPHLLVIPEDETNRQIITGFNTHLDVNSRRIQVEPVAGGWIKALETFKSDHIAGMSKYDKRHVLILIDFDDHPERLENAKKYVPENLKDRVFILGCLSEPEKLRGATGMGKETLGEALAEACLSGRNELWQNELLAHNQVELDRMKSSICLHLRSN